MIKERGYFYTIVYLTRRVPVLQFAKFSADPNFPPVLVTNLDREFTRDDNEFLFFPVLLQKALAMV